MFGYFVRHGTAGNLVMLAMLLAGVWGLLSIRTQHWPDVPDNRGIVTVRWPGAAAADVDAQILTRLEPALRGLDGVQFTTAAAQPGRARVWVVFEPEQDQAGGVEALRAATAAVSLPETAEPPTVEWPPLRDRVMDLVIHGPVGFTSLESIARDLRDRLFRAGVTRVRLDGAPSPVLDIEIDPDALLRHDLTPREIADTVAQAAAGRPVGALTDSGPRMTAGQDRRTLDALGAVILRKGPEGQSLVLRDVARLEQREGPRVGGFVARGHPAVRLVVLRGPEDDALRLLRTVESTVAAFRPGLPAGVDITEMRGRVRDITDRLGLLAQSGAVGLMLVLALLFLFLSARTALWVALGIPVAMAGSLGLMAAAGFTLDMMSLFALILCLGIVVDDAIVVGEHAEALAAQGLDPASAAEQAARRMFGPVIAATLTTIIGFLSLLMIGGRFGALMEAIPLVVSVALAASLLECFVVLPAHMRHALARRHRRSWIDRPSRAMMRAFEAFRDGVFRAVVVAVVRHRLAVAAAATGLLFAAGAMILDGSLPWRFFHAPERGSFTASFAMRDGSDPAEAEAMLSELFRAVEEIDATFQSREGAPAVRIALGRLGSMPSDAADEISAVDPEMIGSIRVELTDPDARPFSQNDVLRAFEAAIRPHPQLETLRLRGAREGGGETLSVVLEGADAPTVKAAAEALKATLSGLEGVAGLDDTLPFDSEALRIHLTPLGRAMGLDMASLARQLRDRFSPIDVVEFPQGDSVASVRMRLPPTARTRGLLEQTWIRADDAWVRLAAVASIEAFPAPKGVYRENGLLVVRVRGEIAEDDAALAANLVRRLETEILPELAAAHAVTWRLSGLRDQERRFLADALRVGALCLAGIYATLAWVFGSWTRPVIVMLVIPFGLVGAVWGHVWMDMPLSMFSVVGLIGMAGIIVNGAIVLVGAIDETAQRRPLGEAIVTAACSRLRPVFLTTATTVAGLAPMLADRSTQAAFLKPTAVTLVFGVGFGMVLVLVLTPALVALARDATRSFAALRRAPGVFHRRAAWRRSVDRGRAVDRAEDAG